MDVMSLTELGLGGALAELARETAARAPVACTADVAVNDVDVPREAALQLYRIAQEALANALKHAAASRVHLTLRPDGDDVILSVTDTGAGIADGGRLRH